MASKSVGPAAVALLGDSKLNALTLGQADPGLLTTDDAVERVSNYYVKNNKGRLTKRWSHGW